MDREHLVGDDNRSAFDFAELFTVATRHLLRRMSGRNLRFAFDCRGPLALLSGEALAMPRSLYRVLHGSVSERGGKHGANQSVGD